MAELPRFHKVMPEADKSAFLARNLNVGTIFRVYQFSAPYKYYIITKTTAKCVYYKPVNFITLHETLTLGGSIDRTEQIAPDQNYAYVKGQARKMKSKITYYEMFHDTIEDDNQFIQLGDTIGTVRYLN